MIVKVALFSSYLILTGIVLRLLYVFRNGSPFYWFTVAQAAMALGTFALIDPENGVHLTYSFLFFLAFFAFEGACIAYLAGQKVGADLAAFRERPEQGEHQDVRVFTVIMFLLCVIITVIYYRSVGYNVFVQLFAGGVDDYSAARIASYSGDDYFAPGYVNQFKNVLLPVTATAIGFWLKRSRDPVVFYGYLAFAIPVTFLALAGTGQRGYLFYTSAALVCAYALHTAGTVRVNLLKVGLYSLPVLLAFVIMTAFYYGRADEGGGVALRDTVMRFTTIQQESSLIGFEYVSRLETQWFADWWAAVVGILPGREGSTVAHEVFAIMYGSMRGTAPLSTIGSAYYNGGIAGVAFLFVAIGLLYAMAYRAYLRGPKTVLRSICYGFIFLYLALYLIETPVSLIDNGVLAIALFLWIASLLRSRRQVLTAQRVS